MDIFFTKHALQRMFERDVPIEEVTEAIANAQVIAEYLDDKPYPSVLVKSLAPGKPLHVVYSKAKDRHIVITAYRPSSTEWNVDYTERR